jgi:hypothetical protein
MRPPHSRLRRLLALAPLVLAVAGCVQLTTPPGVVLASSPPGARVLVDGRDAGFVTPCRIAIGNWSDHEVVLSLPGYVPVEIRFETETDAYVVPWRDMRLAEHGEVSFPLFWPLEDFVAPVKVDNALSPARVFVRLAPEADG